MHAEAGGVSRLLMTVDAVGGVWTYGLELTRALGAAGVEVALAVLGPPPSRAQRDEAAAVPGVTLFEHPGRLEWMDEPWSEVADAGRWLLDLERAFAPEIVHLNGYCHGALPWRAPVLIVGHSCVLSWWRAVHGAEAPSGWRRYANEVGRGLRAAPLVVAPSRAMMRALHDHYGALPRTLVIPNGRTPGGIPREPAPFVLTAGRLWDDAKNVEAVCAVAKDLPWPVCLAGPTSGRGLVCANVRALGRLEPPQLAEVMARASIFALPARYEPFGLSILEAAQSGCALVLGRIDSLREMWTGAARFVDPDDRDGLRDTLRTLVEDESLRRTMAARAAARARAFTPARMAAAYAEAYRTVTEAAHPVVLP